MRARSHASPSPETLVRLEEHLCFALYSASRAFTRAYAHLLSELGLTYPQYLVMLVLWEGDAQSVSALGDKLALDSGTLTPLLKRLEAQGQLSRERDAEDERRVIVRLTDAGRKLRIAARGVPPQIARSTGCELGEIVELTRQLTSVRDALSRRTEH